MSPASLQTQSTQNSPSAARPGPVGHTEASWVPQSRPGRRRGVRGHMPRVTHGGSAFSHVPPTPVPRRTDITLGPGPFPQAFRLCRGRTRRTEAAWAQGCG